MIMKKSMILAAAAALALAACAKVETFQNTNEENAILFGAYSGKVAVTKAAPIANVANLAAQGGFGVFAYYTGSDAYSSSATPNFMYNQNVTSADNGSTWTYSPIKYWPNNDSNTTNGSATWTDKLSFFAYAPYVAEPSASATYGITALSANNAAGDPTVTYKIAANPANSMDLLYSNANLKDQTKPSVSAKVQFTFVHALSRLEFSVQGAFDSTTPGAGAVDANTKIYVNSVKIQSDGISKEGTLNLNTGVWTLGAADNAFNPAVNVPAALQASEAGVTATEVLLHGDNEYFMLFPTAAAVAYNFSIDYDVITTDGNLAGGNSTVNNKITKTASIKFEAGKAYKVKLVLGMTTVKIETTVTDWSAATDQDPVWLPINNS